MARSASPAATAIARGGAGRWRHVISSGSFAGWTCHLVRLFRGLDISERSGWHGVTGEISSPTDQPRYPSVEILQGALATGMINGAIEAYDRLDRAAATLVDNSGQPSPARLI